MRSTRLSPPPTLPPRHRPPCRPAATHLCRHPPCGAVRSSQVEANASRVREQQTRISQLELQMRNQAQLEEEIKMYKEQARSLAEQSALSGGERGGRRASTPAGGGTPRATTPRATSTPGRSREPAAAAASPAPVAEGGTGLFGGLGAKMQAAQAAASKRASGLITQGASLVNEYAAQPPAAAPDQ